MSLAILFHFLCAQHASDINISIIRSLRVYPCCRLKHSLSLLHGYHCNPTTPKRRHTSNQEHTTNVVIQQKKSQAPDDGYINVRNMLSSKLT